MATLTRQSAQKKEQIQHEETAKKVARENKDKRKDPLEDSRQFALSYTHNQVCTRDR